MSDIHDPGGVEEIVYKTSAAGAGHPDSRSQLKLVTLDELLARQPPGFLIDSILPECAICALYGKPKSGKTFIALDWALSIAAGVAWNSRKVKRGVVVYVAAEGAAHLGARIRAWCKEQKIDPREDLKDRFFVIDRPVQFLDPGAVGALVALVRQHQPVLVVIDTLARCMRGGEENLAKDMGLFVAACDELRAATGGSVLVVHHAGRDDKNLRGSSALDGAVDTIVKVSRSKATVTVDCEAQRDAEPFERMAFELRKVDFDPGAGGDDESSCILVAIGATKDTSSRREPREADEEVLVAFSKEGATKTLMVTELEKATRQPRATIHRALAAR